MTVTIEYIEEKFNYFNATIFNNSLSPLQFKLIKNKALLGKLEYRKVPNIFNKPQVVDTRLCISALMDWDATLLENTIIHEMIHYHILMNNIKDDAIHGTHFKKIMQQINKQYNRNITISYHYSEEEVKQINNRRKVHLICLVEFVDGKKFIKAVPRIDLRIRYINQKIKSNFHIKNIHWYLTDAPFFNVFPVSSTLKLYLVSDDEINKFLTNDRDVTKRIQEIL